MPGSGELDLVLNGLIDSAGLTGNSNLTAALRESTLAAAGGLTTLEAENAFALSVIESGTITPAIVAREKAQALKKGGLLEVITTTESLASIGGLEALKAWLLQRREAFTKRARDYDKRSEIAWTEPKAKSNGTLLRTLFEQEPGLGGKIGKSPPVVEGIIRAPARGPL